MAMLLSKSNLRTGPAAQETKLVEQKLTRELACVEGWESFWAIAEQPKGRAGARSLQHS